MPPVAFQFYWSHSVTIILPIGKSDNTYLYLSKKFESQESLSTERLANTQTAVFIVIERQNKCH